MYHILIAEPDQTMSLVLSRIIQRFDNDAKIFFAITAREIIETVRREKINILFLNLSTQSQSLIEAGKELRKLNPELYICIMSVFDISYYGKELFALRVDRYLTKPFSSKEVTALLRDFRQQSTYRPVPAAKRLISCIEMRNFPAAYTAIMPAIKALAAESADEMALRNELLQLADYIMNVFLGMDHSAIESDKFFLNILWCREYELLKIWFFNVIEHVFQRISLMNYGILDRFFIYIEENKYKHFSLSDIAEGCNISQGYLSRTFKSEFSMSVMDYVKLKKIQIVKLDLVFSQYSLSELAARTGFYDGGHMHRLFQQYEKISIQEFKDKTQNKLVK